jgi:hypothetical protein
VVYASNDSTASINVAHATYTASGSSWSWDNTGTAISLGSFNGGFMLGSIVWTGTYLIVAMRANSTNYGVIVSYTTTKAGNSGWTALAILDGGNLGSHCYPLLRHDDVNGCTIAVYSLHNDTLYARVLPDSSSPAIANWSAATNLTGATAINVGSAILSAAIDTANKRIHVVYANALVSTNPYYVTVTYTTTTLGTPSTPLSLDSGAAAALQPAIALDSQATPKVYIFWATGVQGAASDVEYVTLVSPYTSASGVTNLTGNTANDNAFPHVVVNDALSGYVPLLYQRSASSPYALEFDNTITLASTYTGAATITGQGDITAAGSISGIGGGIIPGHGKISGAGIQIIAGAATIRGHGNFEAIMYLPGTGIGDLAVSTRSQTWANSTNGAGSGTETDVIYTDGSGGGWSMGLIPTYGGMPISSWYEVDGNAFSNNQHTLATTLSGGGIHLHEQIANGTFGGSEDFPFTMTELGPTGTGYRRYYQCSFGPDEDGFNWVGYACIYPGDPGLIAYRFDMVNPSASPVSMASSDAIEIALIGSLQQVDATWQTANGGYGTLAGTDQTPWPSGLTTIDPDYAYMVPAAGSGIAIGWVTAKQKAVSAYSAPVWSSAQVQYLQNATRLKLKVQASVASNTWPASVTQTVYLLRAMRRNLVAADARAIAADYIAPGTPSAATGTFIAFSYDEISYVYAAAAGSLLTTTLDLTPTHVTARYKPRFKITNWTGGFPIIKFNGAQLVAGQDFRYYNDSANTTLYVQLYFDVVATGAITGQRNNGSMVVVPGVLSGAVTIHGQGKLVASGAVTWNKAATLHGQGAMTAHETLVNIASAPFQSHGKLLATGATSYPRAATLHGQGKLLVTGVSLINYAPAIMIGQGRVLATAIAGLFRSATVVGQGRITATVFLTYNRTATLIGHGSLSVIGVSTWNRAATLHGQAGLVVSGVQVLAGAATFKSQGRVIAVNTLAQRGQVTFKAQARVTATQSLVNVASVTLPGHGALHATDVVLYLRIAHLPGRGFLVVGAVAHQTASVVFPGLGRPQATAPIASYIVSIIQTDSAPVVVIISDLEGS